MYNYYHFINIYYIIFLNTYKIKAYKGRFSDSFITNDSGFLNKLEPGDQVLADKGFLGIKPGVKGQNSILVSYAPNAS